MDAVSLLIRPLLRVVSDRKSAYARVSRAESPNPPTDDAAAHPAATRLNVSTPRRIEALDVLHLDGHLVTASPTVTDRALPAVLPLAQHTIGYSRDPHTLGRDF
jgi:hypothetical protein